MRKHILSAVITNEDEYYVARCVEMDVTSQGKSVEEARANLKEAVELYVESFGADRLLSKTQETFCTTFKIAADDPSSLR